jgi:flagellar hook-associated protein 2
MSFIDGIASGLNTTEIIDALMAVERLPQQRVEARRARSREAAEQLGSMRTSVTNLRNAASDLRLGSGWERLTGVSSNESVQVEATSGGFTGSLTFRVDSLATTNVVYSKRTAESLETVLKTGNTLAQEVERINGDRELNFVAVAIDTGDGYRLQLAAKEGGADSEIDLDNTTSKALSGLGGAKTLTEGSDAQITFDGDNPYSITSAENTFAGIMPGVNVTVSEVTTGPVTVSVEHDYEQLADSVGALVEQFNELKSTMAGATRVDPNLDAQVPLAFNSDVRRSEQGLLNAFVDLVDDAPLDAASLAGVTVERDGTLSFDREKFIETATEDLDGVTRLFIAPGEGDSPGILDRLVAAADQAAAFGTGLLSTAEESEKARIEGFSDQIDAFEARLERKELQLRRTYTALETALGQLNSQSNWLAGQLSNFGNNGNGS